MDLERPVLALIEERRVATAAGEGLADDVEFATAVLLGLHELLGEGRPVASHRGCPGQLVEHAPAELPVDRASVVGIDEVEVQEFAALVEVGNARRRDLDEGLGQRVERSEMGDPGLEGDEVLEEAG